MIGEIRRIVSLLCALLLVAGVCGCSRTSGNPAVSSDDVVNEPAGTSTETKTEAASEPGTGMEEITTYDEEPTGSSVPETTAPEVTGGESSDSGTTSPDAPAGPGLTPAAWTLTGPNGNTVTLLGTMHVLKESDYPMPAELAERLASASVIAVECDTIAAKSDFQYQLALATSMYYTTSGDDVTKHISPESVQILTRIFSDFGLDFSLYKLIKPWALYSVLDSLPLASAGYDKVPGYDEYLLEYAKQNGIEIREVESVVFQTDLLVSQPDRLYDLLFQEYAEETPQTMTEAIDLLHDLWASGDIAGIEGEMSDETELPDTDADIVEAFYRAMYTDRNAGMAKTVKELLAQDKNVLFAVGAAHFVGEDGIISLLEKEGLNPVRIEYH